MRKTGIDSTEPHPALTNCSFTLHPLFLSRGTPVLQLSKMVLWGPYFYLLGTSFGIDLIFSLLISVSWILAFENELTELSLVMYVA